MAKFAMTVIAARMVVIAVETTATVVEINPQRKIVQIKRDVVTIKEAATINGSKGVNNTAEWVSR